MRATKARTCATLAVLLIAAACGTSDDAGNGVGAPAEPVAHPGVTDEHIEFGYIYQQGTEDFARALGTEAEAGSTEDQIQAVVRAVNEAGGIAGRQLRLHVFGFTAGEPVDSQMQAACAFFTQDNDVFAVSGQVAGVTGGPASVLYECLARKDVVYIDAVAAGDTAEYERFPGLAYAPGTLNADRAVAVMIDALEEAGWFGDEAVVGVHSLENPMWRRVIDEVVEPRMAELGYPIAGEFSLRLGPGGPENIGDYGAAALRFNSAGVTHVLNVGNHPLLFANAAASQEWRPKWSVYSDQAPANWAPAMPEGQFEGALGIGWAPSRDVLATERGEPVNSAEDRCAEIMNAAGLDTTPSLAWQFQLNACSAVFFLESALEGASEITTASFAERVSALDGHLDPMTWETSFAPGRRDGAAAYRMLGYVEECNCLRYVSDAIAID